MSQSSPVFTWLAALDCEKYPPSLCYLLTTLGPAFLALAWLDRDRSTPAPLRPLLVFGRVPMFCWFMLLKQRRTSWWLSYL